MTRWVAKKLPWQMPNQFRAGRNMPDNWHDCTGPQLRWFTVNGTKSQKSIARLHLRMRTYVREHYSFDSTKMNVMEPSTIWDPHEAAMRAPTLFFPRDELNGPPSER